MLHPALCSQSKEREWESKIPWRQGSCSVMVSVSDFSLEGRRFKSRQVNFWASNRVCQYVVFLVSCSLPFHNHTARATCQWTGSSPSMCEKNNFSSFLQVIGENNVSGPQVYPHIDFAWIGKQSKACAKSNRSLKNCFSAKSQFFQVIGENNVSGPQVYRLPTYWFCVDWKQSKHVRKKQSELEKLFFCKSRFHPTIP